MDSLCFTFFLQHPFQCKWFAYRWNSHNKIGYDRVSLAFVFLRIPLCSSVMKVLVWIGKMAFWCPQCLCIITCKYIILSLLWVWFIFQALCVQRNSVLRGIVCTFCEKGIEERWVPILSISPLYRFSIRLYLQTWIQRWKLSGVSERWQQNINLCTEPFWVSMGSLNLAKERISWVGLTSSGESFKSGEFSCWRQKRKPEWFSLTGLEESKHPSCKLPVRAMWQGPLSSLQELAGKQGLQSYNHKEINFANNHWAWKRILSSRWKPQPWLTLLLSTWRRSREST